MPWSPSTLPDTQVVDIAYAVFDLSGAQRWMWGTIPPTGLIKVWMGASWEKKPIKVWDGTAWVPHPMKFNNGYGYRQTA